MLRLSGAGRKCNHGEAWDSARSWQADPPGMGNFLIEVGSRPGNPVHAESAADESAVSHTDKRWNGDSDARFALRIRGSGAR
ncbi:hypothetical protein [Streptomyces sp. AA1529]|uniref:hypothetical protein n=1 Tax=Streptomyces sp. AA1529 TaxID=1203257 RepID=UPI003D71DDF9